MSKKWVFFILVLGAIGLIFLYKLYYFYQARDENIVLYGNVDIRKVDLGFRVSGRLKEMRYEEGDEIKAGTLIALLDPIPQEDEVRQAKAAVESIEASLSNAEKLLARREILIKTHAVSQEDLDDTLASRDQFKANLKQAQANLAIALTHLTDTQILTPSPGTVLTRIREPGTILNYGEPVYTVALKEPLWIRAYASEPILGRLYSGLEAEIYTDTKTNPVYHGHIGYLSPVAEFTPKNVETTDLRTDLVYMLRIYVDDADKGLLQGMPVTVKFKPHNQKAKSELRP